MFQNEGENNFLLQNFLELGNKPDKSKLKLDFPLKFFEQTLKNLLDMFQVDGTLEIFKQNLEEMTKLSSQFSDTIYTIFNNRLDKDNNPYLYLFLIELMKVPDHFIQAHSLTISTNLLRDHEEVVKLFVDNNVYSNILDFFLSDDLQLVISVSDFFNYSIITSPRNFVSVFLEDFVDDFIKIFNELDKNDANSRIFAHFCQIFYTLFDNRYNVSVQILENIYQNILLEIFERRFYIFFLQFVDIILKVHERTNRRIMPKMNEEESEEEEDYEILDEFALRFYETDFPRHVLSIFNRFCFSKDENRDVYFIDLNFCLKIISKLFKYDIYRPKTTGNTFLENIYEKYPDSFKNEFIKNLEKLINIDKYYDMHGRIINRDDGNYYDDDDFEEEDDDLPKVNPTLFKEIPVNAIHVFIILIEKLGPEIISIISNYKIFSNFINNPDDYNYSKRVALTELCLTAVEYSSDEQFEAFLDPILNPYFLHIVLENIDTGNEKHIKALNEMISSIAQRIELVSIPAICIEKIFNTFRYCDEILERIQSEIEDTKPSQYATSLSMLLKQLQKFYNEVPQNDEGMISDDDL